MTHHGPIIVKQTINSKTVVLLFFIKKTMEDGGIADHRLIDYQISYFQLEFLLDHGRLGNH